MFTNYLGIAQQNADRVDLRSCLNTVEFPHVVTPSRDLYYSKRKKKLLGHSLPRPHRSVDEENSLPVIFWAGFKNIIVDL